MANYAFIGAGNMGRPMIQNLLRANHSVRVFDRDVHAVKSATKLGATAVESIGSLVDGMDVVISVLPAGEHVRSVYDQLWNDLTPEAILIDSSTVDIETSQWSHEQAAFHGLRFIDAPVSGGVSGAAQGTLTFMLGGSDEDVEFARPYLSPMAGNIFNAGGPTAGTAAKIVNNLMLHINLLANAEGSQLAARLGLAPQVFHDIVSASSGLEEVARNDVLDLRGARNSRHSEGQNPMRYRGWDQTPGDPGGLE